MTMGRIKRFFIVLVLAIVPGVLFPDAGAGDEYGGDLAAGLL